MTDATVQPLFANQQPPEEKKIDPAYLQAIEAVLDVANARVLGLLAVLGGIAIWGWAVADPHMLRLYAGMGYSLGVLVPVCLLYSRKA